MTDAEKVVKALRAQDGYNVPEAWFMALADLVEAAELIREVDCTGVDDARYDAALAKCASVLGPST